MDYDNHEEAVEKAVEIIEANPAGESKKDESRSSIQSADNKPWTNSQASSEFHHEVGGKEGNCSIRLDFFNIQYLILSATLFSLLLPQSLKTSFVYGLLFASTSVQ